MYQRMKSLPGKRRRSTGDEADNTARIRSCSVVAHKSIEFTDGNHFNIYYREKFRGNMEINCIPSSRAFPLASNGDGSRMFIEFLIKSSMVVILNIRILRFLSSTRGT
jgi:hypothetical protein